MRLDWRRDNVTVAGSVLNYEDTSDGLLNAYGGVTFTVDGADTEISCEVSGEAIQGEPHTARTVVCFTDPIEEGA